LTYETFINHTQKFISLLTVATLSLQHKDQAGTAPLCKNKIDVAVTFVRNT